jgi:nitrogen fixation protein FixH
VWGIALVVVATLIANFTMITIGLNTHPGLVVDDFYAKGKNHFNEAVVAAEAETRLSWQMELKEPVATKLNQAQKYHFVLKDKQGYPVRGAEVEFAAFRVNNSSKDFTMPMMEIRDGIYVVEVNFSLPGNWDLIIAATTVDGQMDMAKRIFINE